MDGSGPGSSPRGLKVVVSLQDRAPARLTSFDRIGVTHGRSDPLLTLKCGSARSQPRRMLSIAAPTLYMLAPAHDDTSRRLGLSIPTKERGGDLPLVRADPRVHNSRPESVVVLRRSRSRSSRRVDRPAPRLVRRYTVCPSFLTFILIYQFPSFHVSVNCQVSSQAYG